VAGSSKVRPWGAGIAGSVFFLIYRTLAAIDGDLFYLWLFGGACAFCVLLALSSLVSSFKWDRALRDMTRPTGLYGPVEIPTAEDAEAMGLRLSNEDGDGIPLGGIGSKIIYYYGVSHISIRAATNAGKTESSSAPTCFSLGSHRNVIATAKGAELAYLCGPYRRDVLKQDIVIVDPWGQMKGSGLKTHDFNPIGHFPAYAAKRSPELLDKTRAMALQLLEEPENGGGDNKIFMTMGRQILHGAAAFSAIEEAESGELVCNLPSVAAVLGAPDLELRSFLERMRRCELYGGSISRVASGFVDRLDRAPKFAESILSYAIGALDLYDAGGPLASCTQFSDFNPIDLKRKPMSVFFVTPPEKTLLYGRHIGLCLNTLIDLCIEADRFEPRVTVVGDEWAALGVLPSAATLLFQGRSRGVQLVSYVQDTESYMRYGKDVGSGFTTQAEVVEAWAIRSTKDAEEYSKRSGQRSVVTEGIGVPGAAKTEGQHSLNLSEKGIPTFRPDEFLHLPDFTAAVFYKQNPPIIVDLVSYRAVDSWRKAAGKVPGAQPLQDLPIKYRD
jgi:type IV secretory pathway TraG/TraD family ATPase VirD4